MRVADPSRAPEQWLRAQGQSTREIEQILKSFRSDSVPRVCTYRSPHQFLRVHGKSSPKAIYAPNYWADGSAEGSAFGRASQFSGFLTDDEIRQIAKNYYREITAICRNWNPEMASNTFWRITLRGSETLEGLEGPAAPQPTFAEDKRTGVSATQSMLSGGAIQVFLNPRTPFICTPINW